MNTSSDVTQLTPQELEQKVKDWLYCHLLPDSKITVEHLVAGRTEFPSSMKIGGLVTVTITAGLTDEERSRIASERSSKTPTPEHSA